VLLGREIHVVDKAANAKLRVGYETTNASLQMPKQKWPNASVDWNAASVSQKTRTYRFPQLIFTVVDGRREFCHSINLFHVQPKALAHQRLDLFTHWGTTGDHELGG
jgi:hypothetical protein